MCLGGECLVVFVANPAITHNLSTPDIQCCVFFFTYKPRGGRWVGMRCWVRDGATRPRSDTLGSYPVDFTFLVFLNQKNRIERFHKIELQNWVSDLAYICHTPYMGWRHLQCMDRESWLSCQDGQIIWLLTTFRQRTYIPYSTRCT
jgi:hypothetical protein